MKYDILSMNIVFLYAAIQNQVTKAKTPGAINWRKQQELQKGLS